MSIFDLLITGLSWISIIAGSAFLVIGSFGIVRFPDFWSRLHAASVIDSAGMALLLLGMMLQAGLTLITVKLFFIGVFLIITGPTSTHAVANAALVSGSRPLGDDSGEIITPAQLAEAVDQNPEHIEEQPSKP